MRGWFLAYSALALMGGNAEAQQREIELAAPVTRGAVSLEQAIKARRTTRRFAPDRLGWKQLSQLCWATTGVTDERRGLRAAPSAGALYPLELYVVVGKDSVERVPAGVHRYVPKSHRLTTIKSGDLRAPLAGASLAQDWMARAPVIFVIAGELARSASKYGARALRYMHIEAGHAGQNLLLQAEALGLGAGVVGAFQDREVAQTLGLPHEHAPLLLVAVGRRR